MTSKKIYKKLSYDFLEIMVTRRCSMSPPCKHCLRGNPQNVDITNKSIAKLLDQTEAIEMLLIGGGEPFLNLTGIRYIISELRSRRIPLYRMSVVTNGTIDAHVIEPIFREYYDYIKLCRENPYNRFRAASPDEPLILMEVSYDRYHHGINYPKVMGNYQAALSHLARVSVNCNGLCPARIGNAKDLQPEDTLYYVQPTKSQIGILDATHKPYCAIYKTWQLRHKDQIIVCCPIVMTANGHILRDNNLSYEEQDEANNIICNITDDIYSAILRYNTGKPDCISTYLIPISDDAMRELDNSAKQFLANHRDEALLNLYINRFHQGHQATDVNPDPLEYDALHDKNLPDDYRRHTVDNLRHKTQTYDYTQPQPIKKVETKPDRWEDRENRKWLRIFADWIDAGRADNILTIANNKAAERREAAQEWLANQRAKII